LIRTLWIPEIEALLAPMGAGPLQIFRRARLPSAMPHFFAGRASRSLVSVAAIFADNMSAPGRLGIVILNAKNSFRPDLMLQFVVISSLITLTLFASESAQHFTVSCAGARQDDTL
jgi:ABC-type nitrate/sulfonate/bicarbonate transport system permease component